MIVVNYIMYLFKMYIKAQAEEVIIQAGMELEVTNTTSITNITLYSYNIGGGRSAIRLNATSDDLVTAGGGMNNVNTVIYDLIIHYFIGGAGGTWIYWNPGYCAGAQQYNNGGINL